ncbi:MAG: HD domain-containing protein [Planctomycetota bacterium]|nr:HD domain-containing protein [Planctomycetota bacterium]MDA1211044.1 HD domain-containing protein [Planctomycetota bacterium]
MAETTTLSREQASAYTTIELSGLRVGTRLRAPIYECSSGDQNVLLLASGTVITSAIRDKLNQRGISRVRVHKSELSRLTSGAPHDERRSVRHSTSTVPGLENANFGNAQWGPKPDSFIHKVKHREESHYRDEASFAFSSSYTSSVEHTKSFFDNLSSGASIKGGEIINLSSMALEQITDDLDLFISLGIRDKAHEYPYKHGLQSSRMAMAIGAVMGLRKDELYELGIGCLVHDVGMLKIDRKLYTAPRRLSDIEYLEIMKHPSITLDLIKDVKELRMGSRMVAYQMHERFNGTGYPRRRVGRQIHPLARIASVADVFVALISPRPYRQAMLPYYAIEKIVRGCREGLYDPDAVRGLLYTTSMFPVGSFIELSDGRVGKVMRSNRSDYTRPVVQIVLPDNDSNSSEVVDLKESDGLYVQRPLNDIPATLSSDLKTSS